MSSAVDVVPSGSRASPEKEGFALVQAMIDEFRRAAVAIERFEALRSRGAPRSAVSRRVFDEFYSSAVDDKRHCG
jgi:hypothetical protein